MRTRVVIIAAILLSTSVAHRISARLISAWSYQELFNKSDFVVIANLVSRTHDSNERTTLRKIQEKVIGVETQFQTQVVLKGAKRAHFILHHYRSVPSKVAVVNGPSFISFDPQHSTRAYILFLRRERDGRFAPTGGQIDLVILVQEMRSPGEVTP